MLPIIGGLVSAWHGGRIIGGSPKILKAFVWAFPFSFLAYFETNIYLAAIALALCMLGKNTGHGRGFDLTKPKEEGTKPERLEFLISWIEGKIPNYWYEVLFMALVGFAAVSGGVLALAFVSLPSAALLAVGGLFKGVNAVIFDEKTEAREYADGVTAYTALAIVGGFIG